MFFGWEGVGLASYLLIGFWYHRPSANAAAIKAFIVNRVGDFGFALGIFGCFADLRHGRFRHRFSTPPRRRWARPWSSWAANSTSLTLICLLLFMGAMGKSAQFLLHTWLPDAMEGPTPVSALIHAATMVTAGVFLVARLSPLFETAPNAQAFVALIGAVTAFFAGTVALVQNDIKRVIAYSTCSPARLHVRRHGRSALMASACSTSSPMPSSRRCFSSAAGSVIHAMYGEQDMRKMGGLAGHLRITWLLMLIGTLSLTGFPLTAGYFSKDAIIEAAFAHHGPASFCFWLLVISALCHCFLFMAAHFLDISRQAARRRRR